MTKQTATLESGFPTVVGSIVDLERIELPVSKTLGVAWVATDHQFLFHYTSPSEEFQYTKQNVLRSTAAISDPVGFLVPFVVWAQLLMQQAWVPALDWDEPHTNELQKAWRHWFGELVMLRETKIPRCYKDAQSVTSMKTHSFSDASEKAYSAAVYAWYDYVDGSFSLRLVGAKTRLAPLKTVSTPRHELMSAALSLCLRKQVFKTLGVQLRKVNFWTDSMTVGYWIRRQSRNYSHSSHTESARSTKTLFLNSDGMLPRRLILLTLEPVVWRSLSWRLTSVGGMDLNSCKVLENTG